MLPVRKHVFLGLIFLGGAAWGPGRVYDLPRQAALQLSHREGAWFTSVSSLGKMVGLMMVPVRCSQLAAPGFSLETIYLNGG